MVEHHRALALQQVAGGLLAVVLLLGLQVEHVVLDLEGDAGQEPERDERSQLVVGGRTHAGWAAADDPDPQRRDERVPAGLLVGHADVVVVGQVELALADPLELDRLPLDRLAGHALDLAEDEQGLAHAERLDVVQQQADRQDVHGVADVDGDRDAVLLVQGELAAPDSEPSSMSSWTRKALWNSSTAAADTMRLVGPAADAATGRQHDRRSQALAFAKG